LSNKYVKDKISKVKVRIFDQDYILKGSESTQYLESIAKQVDRKMKEVLDKNSMLTPYKVAVLTALCLADEQTKIKSEYESLIQLLEEERKI